MVNAPESSTPARSSALIEQDKGDVRNRAGIASYTAHWNKESSKDTQENTESRKEHYTDVVNGYYDGATELYEYGWGDSFHFCRYYPGEPFYQGIARHEHYLAAKAGLKSGMRVLDVGCGVGGPAREISNFTDCEGTFRFQVRSPSDLARRLTRISGTLRSRRREQQHVPGPPRPQVHREAGPLRQGLLRQGRLHGAQGAVWREQL